MTLFPGAVLRAGPIYGWEDVKFVSLTEAAAKLPVKGIGVFVKAALQFAKEFKRVSTACPSLLVEPSDLGQAVRPGQAVSALFRQEHLVLGSSTGLCSGARARTRARVRANVNSVRNLVLTRPSDVLVQPRSLFS